MAFTTLFFKRLYIIPLMGIAILFLGFFVEISFFPPDYYNYLQIFQNSVRIDDWPYYSSITMVSAEELYLAYSSLIRLEFTSSFRNFILINGLISLLFYYFTVNKMISINKTLSFLLLLPVIYPTINYFLIRSSLPFFIGLLALVLLADRKWIIASLLFFLAINFHNQYILNYFLIIVAFFFIKKGIDRNEFKMLNRLLVFSAAVLTVILFFINNFQDLVVQIFSFLPNAGLTSTKISYLELENQGYRYTSVLSILLYPYFSYKTLEYKLKFKDVSLFFKEKDKDLLFVYFIFALSLTGAAVNIAFIDNSHLAGRLSRFSDYTCTLFLLHTYLRLYIKGKLYKAIIVFIILISPIIYPAVYMEIDWSNIF